jgi:hypothetical protein
MFFRIYVHCENRRIVTNYFFTLRSFLFFIDEQCSFFFGKVFEGNTLLPLWF